MMKYNQLLSKIVLLVCLIGIMILKFLVVESYGFLELFLMIFFLTLFLVNLLKLKIKKLVKVIFIFMILWFSIVSVDYKRHVNMSQPLFVLKNENYDFVGLGYKIVKEYDQVGDYVYQSKDKFYLFGILIDEVKVVANATDQSNVDGSGLSYDLDTSKNNTIMMMRAGGGGSSGGSSGSSSGSHSGSGYYSTRPVSLLGRILNYIIFLFLFFFTAIIFYVKVLRASINSKRLLKIMDDKDSTWNYKMMEKQVIQAFYSIQESWTNMDMTSSKEYMDDNLYEQFQMKLEWMKMGDKQNILKRIRLVDLKPISIHDDEEDDRDLVWFYIKGKMVDYTINTSTNEKIEGSNLSKSFVEFWKFVRKEDRWVLAKILQKEEADKIQFQGKD